MRRELLDGLLDRFAEMPLAVEIVRSRSRILELQWPVVVFPVPTDRLEQHERIARAVAQLVLRQIRRNGVDPGGELARPVEAVNVAIDSHEDFLHQVFRAFTITSGAIDKIQQTILVPIDQFVESS
jgi:hypothetical protein